MLSKLRKSQLPSGLNEKTRRTENWVSYQCLFICLIKGISLIVTVGLIEELPVGECVTGIEGDAQNG